MTVPTEHDQTQPDTITATFLGGPFSGLPRELPVPLEAEHVIGGREYPRDAGYYVLAADGVTYTWFLPDPGPAASDTAKVAPTPAKADPSDDPDVLQLGEHVRPARRQPSRTTAKPSRRR